jgi:hypothetical protein
MAVHGTAGAMRGSSSSADITEQALACALAQTSLLLSPTSLTSVSWPAATHLAMVYTFGTVAGDDDSQDDDGLLEMDIVGGRKLLATWPPDHPLRTAACKYLAYWLDQQLEDTGSIAIFEEVIALEREVLALQPAGHTERAIACNNLANTLRNFYQATGNSDLLDESITLHREALDLHPAGHPRRAMSCSNIAIALETRYKMSGNSDLLDEMITMRREALALRSTGHPLRATSCNDLASALHTGYEVTGITALLDEATTLHREALALRPAGHPDRSASCSNLAIALQRRCEMTSGSDLLDETITLHREALALCPAGHPDRAISCNNLAVALISLYEVTGVTALLDEVITLRREALYLRPAGHLDRAMLCNNLASSLQTRYGVTGSSDLLDEAITLHREALFLTPAGHPHRAGSCNNLAVALRRRYGVTGITTLLDEAITLHREALDQCPARHPTRSDLCSSLATALGACYGVTGSSALLDEEIMLNREALALRPTGHPAHASSCHNLAAALWQHYQKTLDSTVIGEAIVLARESAASCSPSSSWRPLKILCRVHLDSDSSLLSISTAAQYLSQASALYPDNPALFLQGMQAYLDLIWLRPSYWTAEIARLLSNVYSNLIDRLSRMTGFVLDTTSQLAALKSARLFGPDACIAALFSNNPCQAMELLDHAHGVIWAQALHQRDPQLQQLPDDLASQLGMLLRAVSVPVVASDHETSEQRVPSFLSPQDIRHEQNSCIQTLLTEIRAMPGLDRFMLGHTYAELRKTADKHPVVVLASAHGLVYALIICNSVQEHPDALPLKITSDRLARLRHTATRAGLRTRTAMRDVESESDRQMRPGRFEDTALGTLASLWHDIVKPVVEHLQLPVRI